MALRRSTVLLLVTAVACSTGVVTDTTASTLETTTTPPPETSRSTTTTVPDETSTTAPFEEPGMLLVVGDWGSGTAPQGAVAGAMARLAEANPIHAVLTTGDNLYIDDAEFLLAPYDWVTTSSIPFWITWGDHDIETSRREGIVNQAFGNPPKWTTYEWGAVSIVILDSNQVSVPEQLTFLDDQLTAASGPTIVVFHHPAYSCSRHGSDVEVQDHFVDRFDDDVLLVLSGHDHGYQRIEEGPVTYVVTGGGGRPLDEIEECGLDTVNSAELHHFVVLQQTRNVIQGTAVDVNGEPFDEFFINLDDGIIDLDY